MYATSLKRGVAAEALAAAATRPAPMIIMDFKVDISRSLFGEAMSLR
jgi:hypothetical protein